MPRRVFHLHILLDADGHRLGLFARRALHSLRPDAQHLQEGEVWSLFCLVLVLSFCCLVALVLFRFYAEIGVLVLIIVCLYIHGSTSQVLVYNCVLVYM